MRRSPYLLAALVVGFVWLIYILTLAPTVTFWDAGEFIAAAKVLGIPHPPGTPLFVMMAHVWAGLLPIGEFAVRTNLLSALMSALGAGCFFLVVRQSLAGFTAGLEPRRAQLLRNGGALAAALIGAFTFTNWQNSNETEVYAVATFTIAAICWLSFVWRARRGTPSGDRILLLIIYLGGISVANHLLALLAGPAVVVFLVAVLREAPAARPEERRREWALAAVVAGVWALLIGSGLGNTTLTLVGAVCFAAATLYAVSAGAGGFALLALGIAAIGLTPYLYLFLRSAQHPILNEAAPHTWNALLAVVRRAQYPVRTPLDDPTVLHGPDNPGRSLAIVWLQIQNYLMYFDWQWAKGLTGAAAATSPLRLLVTIAAMVVGIRGFLAQRRFDRSGWWLLFTVFLVTGAGLVVYMNFKPGFSQGYDRFPDFNLHEVRERDYFFVVSFIVWGLWVGIGLATLARWMMERGRGLLPASAVLCAALLPLALNWSAATRKGPDGRLAADFAYDLLNSVPPYGVLFVYGDNDTFPVWWAQEVEGIRQDVTVVCLALANTDWYLQQLRDLPIREFRESSAPPIWQGLHPVKPSLPTHTMTDEQIAAAFDPNAIVALGRPGFTVDFGPFQRTYPPNTFPEPNQIASIRIVQQNLGHRPIVWATTTGRDFAGLGDYVIQRGLGFTLLTARPDTTAPGVSAATFGGVAVDVPVTRRLAWDTYRYAGLLRGEHDALETTAASIASSLSLPFGQLAAAAEARGDTTEMVRNLERSLQLSPNPALRAAFDAVRTHGGLGVPAPTNR
jgi:hypothetical protein